MNINELITEFRLKASQLGLNAKVCMDGSINASTIIVGEGPGETEARTGKPFTGSSGSLLWDCLRPYGIFRPAVYATNIVKRQISLSREANTRLAVGPHELQRWSSLFKWELAQLPNVRTILVLGNYALGAVVGETAITKWRGSVLDVMIPPFVDDPEQKPRRVKVVCTINPAYAMREPSYEPIFQMDVFKLNSCVQGTFRPHVVETVFDPSFAEAMEWIRYFGDETKPDPVLDIEFSANETDCYGFSNDPNLGVCINFRDATTNRYSRTEETDLLLAIKDKIAERRPVVIQNAGFDATWCWFKDRIRFRTKWDTLLAHHTLYPRLPHSLAFLVAQYTTHPYYKDEGQNWKESGDIGIRWAYNCKDTALTKAVEKKEERELRNQNLLDFFLGHVMRAKDHLIQGTVEGVAIDTAAKEQAVQDSHEDLNKLYAEFFHYVKEATGREQYYPNPNSPKQMGELLFVKMKLIGRGKSTDDTNRQHMMKHPGTNPVARELLTSLAKLKKEEKFCSTYAESKIDEDGRMRCDWKQSGVQRAPGRLSSAATLWGTGQNLQNQPPRARSAFIADEGCVFIYFDLKQAEAQVVSFRADIPTWKEQYARSRVDNNYDAHRALAAEMFKLNYDAVPKKDTFIDGDGVERYTVRYTSKRCRHGLNYRMQPDRLSEVTGLGHYESRRAFKLYHAITPELEEWWGEEEREFLKNRAQFNAFGRRNKVIQRIDDDVLESIIAFYPQSTIGDKVTKVWYQSQEDSDWPVGRAAIRMNIHDALIGVAYPQYAKQALRVMVKHAEEPIYVQDIYKRRESQPLIIPAEPKISVPDEHGVHRWSTLKDVNLAD